MTLQLSSLLLILPLSLAQACGAAAETAPPGAAQSSDPAPADGGSPGVKAIPVSVEPAVELVCVMYRLAEIRQYEVNALPRYIRKIEEHFGPHRDHPAIALVKELYTGHRINGSAPMALAVYLTAPPELEGRIPLSPSPEDLDPRWSEETIARFQEAARAFSKDTGFPEFWAANEELYARSEKALKESLEGHEITPWLQEYFGEKADAYTVIVGMQIGRGNYGMRRTREDGSAEFLSIIGASSPSRWSGVPRFDRSWLIRTVVHEFAHPFVNPFVDANEELLREVGEKLHAHLADHMMRQGYSTWQHVWYEYLVRAVVLRYLHQSGGEAEIPKLIEKNELQGFPKTELLAAALAEYEADREQYPTMDRFLPRAVECLEEILQSID